LRQTRRNGRTQRRAALAASFVALQGIAALYFLGDGIDDIAAQMRSAIGVEPIMECIIAVALLAGTILGARYTQRLLADARRSEQALGMARGAMAQLIDLRFAEWNLTRSEAEVALFAIKGSTIPDIARLRGSAEGTVRSQLSQVYAKAGVANQTMLLALFLDDLIEPLAVDDAQR
jgi:DNA-binding NarL/FixJ family response regulator